MDVDAEYRRMVSTASSAREVAIIGAGPAGLFAAEIIASAGHRVTIYERMPSPARKFLLAGRGGLNLTHSEQLEDFVTRYGDGNGRVQASVEAFPPSRLVAWANDLGAATFVGTSGRVFPKAMKASPLLRAWLRRLDSLGVVIRTRHRWKGFGEGNSLLFDTPAGDVTVKPAACLFALGGASWPRLGSDGSWVERFEHAGIRSTKLLPANCGVIIPWSEIFKSRFAGHALKRIAISVGGKTARGEAIITETGLEGGAIYSVGPSIRAALAADGEATLMLDLKPDLDGPALTARLQTRRPKETMTNFLRKAAHLSPAAVALLREGSTPLPETAEDLAARVKAVAVRVVGLTSIERAISTAGGLSWGTLDEHMMIASMPGMFAAGEMLDWEAPTGGFLLQGTFATAAAAANGLLRWLS